MGVHAGPRGYREPESQKTRLTADVACGGIRKQPGNTERNYVLPLDWISVSRNWIYMVHFHMHCDAGCI
jgi:hypothetical protein